MLYLKNEANDFINTSSSKYSSEDIVVSFSGGKDSTVVSDLVVRALTNPIIVHIFGNTTLEFPLTLDYAKRFKRDNAKTIFKKALNKEQDFYSVCNDIGPPARMMRLCCSMFKTGPITRVPNNLYKNKNILTYYGIRKCEFFSRSKYNRIENNAESLKIQKQTVASPIFFWKDIDIWLYILAEKIDFNDAYRLGYDRVGCWCCPNKFKNHTWTKSVKCMAFLSMWLLFDGYVCFNIYLSYLTSILKCVLDFLSIHDVNNAETNGFTHQT